MPADNIAIKIRGVSKYYKLYNKPKQRLKEALHPFKKKYHKKHYALKDISLDVKKGEVLGIIGRNGCGKSTLLKLITGVLQPSQGNIEVDGKVTALLELGAGFNPEFTGLDNIHFYAKVLGLSNKKIAEKIDSIVEFSELGEFLQQPIKTYSSGMKSRLGFAVAIHVEPDILILDEVLAVGDAQFRRKCHAKIEELFSMGCTVILVSHSDQAIAKMCTRAIMIENNGIAANGETRDIIKIYQDVLLGEEKKRIALKTNRKINSRKATIKQKSSKKLPTESPITLLSCHLSDSTNNILPILECRQKCCIQINIRYHYDHETEVRIAFNIRDTQGVVMGGGVIEDIVLNGQGEKLFCKNIFQSFSPGNYFITATCNQKIDNSWTIIERDQDAFKFQIKQWPEEGYWGGNYLAPIK